MSYVSILPPGSTPLERALEQTGGALLDFDVPLRLVWSPAHCPVTHLPWLAWSVAISHWKTTWSVAYKRAAIADAISYHRRKGTRRAVEEVLARYHPAFRIVEWHEANPRRAPHTFQVRAPASEISPDFLTAALAAEIVADVAIAKPARAHFAFVQTVDLTGALFLAAGSAPGSVFRADFSATHDTSRDWSIVLQTEDGEPILTEDGLDYLETA